MRAYFRLFKPYLYVAVLYFIVRWALESHRIGLAEAIVGVAVAVALYLSRELRRDVNTYANAKGFAVNVKLRFEKVEAHPYMLAASQVGRAKFDAMRAANQREEWDKLLRSTPFGLAAPFVAVYHQGLVWSEDRKLPWIESHVEGRPWGAALDGQAAQENEPTLVLHEKFGVLTVLLVPVQEFDKNSIALFDARELSINNSVSDLEDDLRERLFKMKRRPRDPFAQRGEPPAVVLAQFPLRQMITYAQLPEAALGWSESDKVWAAMQKDWGLESEPETHEPGFHTPWFTWQNEFVKFSFQNLE